MEIQRGEQEKNWEKKISCWQIRDECEHVLPDPLLSTTWTLQRAVQGGVHVPVSEFFIRIVSNDGLDDDHFIHPYYFGDLWQTMDSIVYHKYPKWNRSQVAPKQPPINLDELRWTTDELRHIKTETLNDRETILKKRQKNDNEKDSEGFQGKSNDLWWKIKY